MITGTGLITRGLVEGAGAAGLASRGLVTAIEQAADTTPAGSTVSYQPRHWLPNRRLRWRRRVP